MPSWQDMLPWLEQTKELVLWAVLPALAVAIVVTAGVALLGGAKQATLAGALALAAAAAVGFWCCATVPLVPGESAWNRLPWAALGALWVGRVARLPNMEPAAGWLLRAAAAVLITLLVVPSSLRSQHDWLAPGFAALVFALWVTLDYQAATMPGGLVSLLLAVVLAGAGGVLIHAGSALFMNVAMVLASALAGIAVVAWWFRLDVGGAMPGAAVMLPGLLLAGHQETFSELPWHVFALPVLAPLLLAEASLFSQQQEASGRVVRAALMWLLTLIPLAVALYIANAVAPLEL
jgi:hypothetical protein